MVFQFGIVIAIAIAISISDEDRDRHRDLDFGDRGHALDLISNKFSDYHKKNILTLLENSKKFS